MSALMQLAVLHLTPAGPSMAAHSIAAHTQAFLAADNGGTGGLLDWATAKNAQTQTLMRAMAVTLGIVFIFIQGVISRGAMARILIATISAGIFVYAVWNITAIQDRVGNEVNGMSVSVVHTTADLRAPSRPDQHQPTVLRPGELR
jgi:hypothetical protein